VAWGQCILLHAMYNPKPDTHPDTPVFRYSRLSMVGFKDGIYRTGKYQLLTHELFLGVHIWL
jgi:hypothetical protein